MPPCQPQSACGRLPLDEDDFYGPRLEREPRWFSRIALAAGLLTLAASAAFVVVGLALG